MDAIMASILAIAAIVILAHLSRIGWERRNCLSMVLGRGGSPAELIADAEALSQYVLTGRPGEA